MTVNFAKLANIKMGDIKKPKPAPVGAYSGKIVDITEGESATKHTPFVCFWIESTSAFESVDADLLEAAGGLGKKFKIEFYITDNSLFRLKEFLQSHLGIETEDLSEAVAEAMGKDVGFMIEHRPNDKDPESPYAQIASTFPLA